MESEVSPQVSIYLIKEELKVVDLKEWKKW